MAVSVIRLVEVMVLSTQGPTPRARYSIDWLRRRLGRNVIGYYPHEVFPPSVTELVYDEMRRLLNINKERRNNRIPVAASIIVFDKNWNIIDVATGLNRYVQGCEKRPCGG